MKISKRDSCCLTQPPENGRAWLWKLPQLNWTFEAASGRVCRLRSLFISLLVLGVLCSSSALAETELRKASGNPVLEGWYADPEGAVLDGRYWIFPTYSAPYDKQVFFDAFSSDDLVNWKKHPRVLDTQVISWAKRAMWAPSVVEKDGKFYFFFAANDVQRPGGPLWDEDNPVNHHGGIGVAVANSPSGPYRDHLGKPLIDGFHNNAQPIDQFVFKDVDGTYHIFYGGWGHCNVGVLNDDFDGFVENEAGNIFTEVTPAGYVEGPVLFRRKGKYYFMWSEGSWGNYTYRVAYAIAESPRGPFQRIGTIMQSDESLATGAGHNSVINVPETDEWYIVYHRHPVPNQGRDHRVTCIDRMYFKLNGEIEPVKITHTGVRARPYPQGPLSKGHE